MAQPAALPGCSTLLQQRRRARAPFAAASPAAFAGAKAQPRQWQRLVARAEGEGGQSPIPQQAQQPQQDDGDTLIEQQLASKRRKPREPKARPQVISAARDQVYGGGPQTFEQVAEGRVVQGLALLFLGILAEGLFLGASGFLSEEVDQFAVDVVYPLFAPTVVVFLLGSSLYGVWKTYFQGRGGPPQK